MIPPNKYWSPSKYRLLEQIDSFLRFNHFFNQDHCQVTALDFVSTICHLLATKLTSCQTSSDENFQLNKLNTASVEWALGEVLTLQPALWTTKHSLAVFTASPSFKSNNSSKMQHRCYPKPNSTSPA